VNDFTGRLMKTTHRRHLSALIERLWYDWPRPHRSPGTPVAATLAALVDWVALALLWCALAPLCLLTDVVSRLRRAQITARKGPQVPPVVVVGNLLAGGTGKTPVAIALTNALAERGWQPGLLARGVGAPGLSARVFLHATTASEAGDEAALLTQRTRAPVAIGRNRAQAFAALLAAAPDRTVIVSDDGLQHRALDRTLELVLIDQRVFGNGCLLPAGPLRESPRALRSADAILLRNAPDQRAKIAALSGQPTFDVTTRAAGWSSLAHWNAELGKAEAEAEAEAEAAQHHSEPRFASPPSSPEAARAEWIDDATLCQWARGKRTIAIAGIAQPDRFFRDLRALPLEFVAIGLGDHAEIPREWLGGLQADCILMTEKDAVKCQHYADPRIRVRRMTTDLPPELLDFLEDRLRGCSPARHSGLPAV